MDRLRHLIKERNLKFLSTGDSCEGVGWTSHVSVKDHERKTVYTETGKKAHDLPGHYDEPANALCDKIERENIRCSAPPPEEEMNTFLVE
jgi:hypothetical protein